MHSVFIRNYCL